MSFGLSAGAIAGLVGAGASVYSASKSGKGGSQTVTQQQELDPRIASILFGEGDTGGLLAQNLALGQQPQSAGSAAFGQAAQNWLGGAGADLIQQQVQGAQGLMGSNIQAPTASAAQAGAAQAAPTPGISPAGMGNVLWNTGESYSAPNAMQAAQVGAQQQVRGAQVQAPQGFTGMMTQASQVNAPAQNNLDLTGAYQNFVSGASGDNPKLQASLQAGADLTNAAFNRNTNTLTDTLRRQVLPGIRSGAVLAGQYGGSRQGIAEGNALSDYTRQLTDANSVLGAQNSANITGQLAQTYNQGQDRALSATQGLGAQQYGVASQNSAQQQQANLANQASANQAAQTGYSGSLQAALANAGYGQQAALANQSASLARDTTNAGLQQQAAQTNYAGDLSATAGSAANRQQANLANQATGNNASQFNAGQIQQANLANQNAQQNNAQFNAGLQQQTGLANMGAANQIGQANLQAQLGTNSLNSANQATGLSGLGGILGSLSGYATNQDNYALNRAQQTNGLVAPYLSANSSTSTQQPLYQNTAGNLLGGAAAGLSLYNQFKGIGQPTGWQTGATNQNPWPT